MKKSILIPYHRYKQLLDDASSSSGAASSTSIDPTSTSSLTPRTPPPFTTTDQQNNVVDDAGDVTPEKSVERGEYSDSLLSKQLTPSNKHRLSNDVIIACLSKHKHSKARKLLKILIGHPKLDWTKEGILLCNSLPIENSHIVDLIDSALDTNKLKSNSNFPNGYFLFRDQLLSTPESPLKVTPTSAPTVTYSSLKTPQFNTIEVATPQEKEATWAANLRPSEQHQQQQNGRQAYDVRGLLSARRPHTSNSKNTSKQIARKTRRPSRSVTQPPPPLPPAGLPDVQVLPKSLNPWKDRWIPY